MSDRAVFVPFPLAPDLARYGYEWADVVIPEGATPKQIRALADQFAGFGGPHKIYVSNRNDPRFVEFVAQLEEHAMQEGKSWGFEVRLPHDSLHDL